jgi:hypothetical protein
MFEIDSSDKQRIQYKPYIVENPIFKILGAIQNEDENCRSIARQSKLEEFGFEMDGGSN